MGWELLKIIFLLLLVLGMMYGTFYLVRRYLFVYDKDSARYNIKIRVLSSQMILPKKFIQIVQVHDKILVLGVADNSINLLYEFEGSAENFKMTELDKQEFKENFLDILKKNLGIK